jgi:hypothetical protein
MNYLLFTAAKAFWKPLHDPSFFGLKIEVELPRGRRSERYQDVADELERYAPGESLALFSTDEICSHDPIDVSIVLLVGNRVASLAEQLFLPYSEGSGLRAYRFQPGTRYQWGRKVPPPAIH